MALWDGDSDPAFRGYFPVTVYAIAAAARECGSCGGNHLFYSLLFADGDDDDVPSCHIIRCWGKAAINRRVRKWFAGRGTFDGVVRRATKVGVAEFPFNGAYRYHISYVDKDTAVIGEKELHQVLLPDLDTNAAKTGPVYAGIPRLINLPCLLALPPRVALIPREHAPALRVEQRAADALHLVIGWV